MPVVYPQQYEGARVSKIGSLIQGLLEGNERRKSDERYAHQEELMDQTARQQEELHSVKLMNEGMAPGNPVDDLRRNVGRQLIQTGPSKEEHLLGVKHGQD